MTASVSFGSDPEFFLQHAVTRRPIPAVGLVGGTKDKPRMVGDFGLQEDNVMAEFTTPPATHLGINLEQGLLGVQTVLGNLMPGAPLCRLHTDCAVMFTSDVLASAGMQALQFGCSPDFDAYNMGERHPRVNPEALMTDTGAWRFAGGHIHVGYKDVCDMPEYVAALMCDVTLGLALTAFGEQQGLRRTLYGMAGRFRPTKYGVEYRTPSNRWLYSERLRLALSDASHVLERIFRAQKDVQVRLFNEVPWNDVRATINSEAATEAYVLRVWLASAYRELGFDQLV